MGIARPVCAANNRPQGDTAGCIALPRSRRRNPAGFASGKLRSYRTPGRSPLRVRASPTGKRAGRLPALQVTRTAGCRPYGGTRTAECRPYGGTQTAECRPYGVTRTAECRPYILPGLGSGAHRCATEPAPVAAHSVRQKALRWRADSPRYNGRFLVLRGREPATVCPKPKKPQK